MPDRADMLPGLLRIVQNPTLSSTNAFSISGFTTGLVCLLMMPTLEKIVAPKLERRALRRAVKDANK